MNMTKSALSRLPARLSWLARWLLALGILYCSYLLVLITLPFLSLRLDIDFLLTKQDIIHIQHWRWAFWFHIFTSIYVIFLGLAQFSRWLLLYRPRLHRMAGLAYVGLVLVASAPGGFVMAVHANGGPPAQLAFCISALLWWYTTWMGLQTALARSFDAHYRFMVRSYALTLTAVSLRLMAWGLPHLFYMRGDHFYVLIAWLSLTVNLALAELVLRTNVLNINPLRR